MMDQPTNYDPPDAVVRPAFRELFERLRRARLSNLQTAEITAEERKAFEYGVAERQKVLGHSLFLVFAQWAIYKQIISRLKSRTLRLAYAMGSVISTTTFVQRRAAKVSKDTFAHIVTTNTDSALGNEARVILAELEGPEGPYFRQVAREHNFVTDFSMIPVDDEQFDVHPQLRLKPRLLGDMPQHPQIQVPRRNQADKGTRDTARPHDWRAMQPRRQETPRTGDPIARSKMAKLGTSVEQSVKAEGEDEIRESYSDLFTTSEELERTERVERAKERKRSGRDSQNSEQDDLWGTPFDFASAARTPEDRFEEYNDSIVDRRLPNEDEQTMTPSQRRAAERRRRRLQAQSRAREKPDHSA
ncbi:hypothetical protein BWQ96_00003 [Gracilariopsis chorda]|uniref:Uncharacterized protein n=1 Tax=Gracilariopsis chorda TaxID=448386 RepID=A0A2V3J6A5_9FLOR|nr:hypothetical protein BWQ96_00003 [Gracilariopsis chorda]|eukprot:PXF49843.1 hypothetical protein BWQ96_00003 [Gracilariopsis chorda]